MPQPSRLWGAALLVALSACSPAPTSDASGTSVTSLTTWTQAVNNDIDLLFVVDESPAMADDQAKVAAQLPVLMETAAGCPANGFPPSVRQAVVSSQDGQLLTDLDGALAGFLRPDAFLGVVIITSTDDASTPPVSTFVSHLRSFKADPDSQIAVMAIVGPSSQRVVQLAQSFPNETVVSIDDDSYAPVLTPICSSGLGALLPPCLPADAGIITDSGRSYPDCAVSEHLTTVDGQEDLLVPACASSAQSVPCWWSGAPPNPGSCMGGGSQLQIVNQPTGSDPGHYSVTLTISCQLGAAATAPPQPGSGG